MQNAFTTLRIIHIALLSGMLAFNIVSLIMVSEGFPAFDESEQRTLQAVCILLSTVCLVAGFQIFKKKMLAARNSPEPGEKRMALYRTACILWWAMIEAPGIMAGIGFILTSNYAFFALAVFHLLIMLIFTPRKANIIVLLNLNSEEVTMLEGRR
ncbi:hypothetical protein [Longitalea luteola]|uniref:hypothetical protein n=1 Tax=Longitalea luteola TaxID=2812563 RepID=UPI001A958E37|nr:hypothetical protein [Longitalea luteola]